MLWVPGLFINPAQIQKVHHVTSIVSFAFEICTIMTNYILYQLYTIPTIYYTNYILYQLYTIPTIYYTLLE